MTPLETACSLFLPEDTLTHFDITHAETVKDEIHITLTEKNNPPKEYANKTLVPKGFKEIMMSDFPVRGKHVVLTYQRRYWQVPGEKEYITNNLPLVAKGTKIETAFAEVLKKYGGDDPDFLGEYRDFIPHQAKGI